MKRFIGFSLLVAFCFAIVSSGQAYAEAEKETKKDYSYYEYLFGSKLIDYKFWDLAEQHFTRYLKDPKVSKEMRPKGYLGLAKLFKEKGKNPNVTAEKRKEYFDKALANLREFLSKWPDKESAEYRTAVIEQYTIEIDRVEAAVNELKDIKHDDPDRVSKQNAATAKLKTAIDTLKQIHDAIRDEKQEFEDIFWEKNPDAEFVVFPEALETRWYSIGYVLARSYSIYPKIFVRGTDEFKKAVNFAMLGLEDFIWEHDTDSVYIQGGIYLARLYGDKFLISRSPNEREEMKQKVKETFQQYVFYI